MYFRRQIPDSKKILHVYLNQSLVASHTAFKFVTKTNIQEADLIFILICNQPPHTYVNSDINEVSNGGLIGFAHQSCTL